MERLVLPEERKAPEVRAQVAAFHREVVEQVAAAVARDRWVVVGMAQNPFVKRARRTLEATGLTYTYLEFGSYFRGWKPRLAIKLWAGFPTFPMVFRDGVLLGGAREVEALAREGKLSG
jgi:glutaredoxin-related protein